MVERLWSGVCSMTTESKTGMRSASVPLGGDPAAAAAGLATALGGEDLALACVYFDRARGVEGLTTALDEAFAGVPLFACSTAGELCAGEGYLTDSLTGFALPRSQGIAASVQVIESLDALSTHSAADLVAAARKELGAGAQPRDCFALCVLDGVSQLEECAAFALQSALGSVPLVGGSAGDGLRFGQTDLFGGPGDHREAQGLLALVHSQRPFQVIQSQHFVPTEHKLVVTDARPETRRVLEFNGLPAAEEYARLVGVPVEALEPSVFARNPLLVKIAGAYHVRSIQRAEPDGSLHIYCAIEEGLVLTLGAGQSMVESLAGSLEGVYRQLGEPQLTIAFDCILRRLEAEAVGLVEELAGLFARYRIAGFNTYGEQAGSLHVNQTFTGVAIA